MQILRIYTPTSGRCRLYILWVPHNNALALQLNSGVHVTRSESIARLGYWTDSNNNTRLTRKTRKQKAEPDKVTSLNNNPVGLQPLTAQRPCQTPNANSRRYGCPHPVVFFKLSPCFLAIATQVNPHPHNLPPFSFQHLAVYPT